MSDAVYLIAIIGRDPTATKKFTTGTFETLFPQNSNSKFGRGSAQILNLNFAAPAGPARPGPNNFKPRPGRNIFAARGGENFVAGVRKSCGLIAKGCAFSLFTHRYDVRTLKNAKISQLFPPEGD